MRIAVRAVAAVALLTCGFTAASAIARVGPAAPLCAQAGVAHRVGVVVEHGDGRVIQRCVGFNTPTVTALAALQATGLETGTESYGALGTGICQIDNEPTQYTTCLPSSGSYWVLFVARGGGPWTTAALGASSTTVGSGDDVGFRYDPQSGADPPPASPAGTCPATTPPPSTSAPSTEQPASARPAQAPPGTPSAGVRVPVTTPTAGVLGASSPPTTAPSAGPISRAGTAPPSLNVGLVLAAIAAGSLVGLIGAQGLRRRHR